MGAVLTIQGKTYDVEKDFTWEELLLAEQQSGVPIARDDAFESMAVIAAFVFVVLKRSEPELTWTDFVKRPIDVTQPDETQEPKAPRPTRAKAAT